MARNFLDRHEAQKRLIAEYDKYGRLFVAVDFDDTLCIYDPENVIPTLDRPENKEVCDLIRKAAPYCFFILWTCRSGDALQEAFEWITNHDIPIHSVNDNPSIDYGGRKVYANLFLDDRAGLAQGFDMLDRFYEEVTYWRKNYV